jgi:hypothetical protein
MKRQLVLGLFVLGLVAAGSILASQRRLVGDGNPPPPPSPWLVADGNPPPPPKPPLPWPV